MKTIQNIVILTFILFGQPSIADTMYCLVVSDVLINDDGKIVDPTIFDKSSIKSPENWIEFNLKSNTTSYFYSDDDGTKGNETENIIKINNQLFYAPVNDYTGYTTYLFEENMRSGILTEAAYVSTFSCVEKSQKEIEDIYGISFKPYYKK